ncbi:hypothetical protein [Enterobacter hormaechei]|uniref:hypothetical protein n=1 Tax=Enterobacter hormaechei TaxID=158836 RepID=UPI001E58A6AD|nr:hypothetical protein [Enterobacter hormaechei]
MSTLTHEWLLKTIAEIEEERDAVPGAVNEDAAMALAAMKLALASLEADGDSEPVAFINGAWKLAYYRPPKDLGLKIGDKLYAAPPAPVSVPDGYRLQPISEYDAMCAAMLQGAEPVTTAYKLPMQPLVIDAHGTLRFKENLIVRKLLDYATEHGYGLNEMAREEFDAEDQMQLAQLIGYSLSGYGTLSYVTDESYECAAATAPQQEVT